MARTMRSLLTALDRPLPLAPLADRARRHPTTPISGDDLTPAILARAQVRAWPGAPPTRVPGAVTGPPLPHAAGAGELGSIPSGPPVPAEPLPVLAEIRPVVAPR